MALAGALAMPVVSAAPEMAQIADAPIVERVPLVHRRARRVARSSTSARDVHDFSLPWLITRGAIRSTKRFQVLWKLPFRETDHQLEPGKLPKGLQWQLNSSLPQPTDIFKGQDADLQGCRNSF